MIHVVKERDNGGFQGKFGTNIKCKSEYGEAGLEGDPALCCKLYEAEKIKHPLKDDSPKRMISYARPVFHLPVLILGNNVKDPNTKSYPVGNTNITTGYKPCFLEFTKSAWIDLYNILAKKLKEESIVEYNVSEEELQEVIYQNLGKVVLQLEGVSAKEGSRAKYATTYTFYPFDDAKIGKASGEHELIVNWEKAPELQQLRNEVTDFLTLLEKREPELTVGWTEEKLTKVGGGT